MRQSLIKSGVGLFVVCSALTMSLPVRAAWTFKVTNSGKSTIEHVEASEAGESWGEFTGSSIEPGATETMEWAPATDDSNCAWKVRAVYKDGPSEPATFDFCKEPHLEFTN